MRKLILALALSCLWGVGAQAKTLLDDKFTTWPQPNFWGMQTANADDWKQAWGPLQHKDAYSAMISGNQELEDYISGNPRSFKQGPNGLQIWVYPQSRNELLEVGGGNQAAKPPYLSFVSGIITTHDRVFTRATPGHPLVIRALISLNSKAKGSWPAIWLLPNAGGWPPELDILEAMPDSHPRQIHTGIVSKKGGGGGWYNLPRGASWAGGTLHQVMGVLDADKKTFSVSVDHVPVSTFDLRNKPEFFTQDFYLIMNVAVGGNWPCNELHAGRNDDKSASRMALCARTIASAYPAEAMTIKRVTIDDSLTQNAW